MCYHGAIAMGMGYEDHDDFGSLLVLGASPPEAARHARPPLLHGACSSSTLGGETSTSTVGAEQQHQPATAVFNAKRSLNVSGELHLSDGCGGGGALSCAISSDWLELLKYARGTADSGGGASESCGVVLSDLLPQYCSASPAHGGGVGGGGADDRCNRGVGVGGRATSRLVSPAANLLSEEGLIEGINSPLFGCRNGGGGGRGASGDASDERWQDEPSASAFHAWFREADFSVPPVDAFLACTDGLCERGGGGGRPFVHLSSPSPSALLRSYSM